MGNTATSGELFSVLNDQTWYSFSTTFLLQRLCVNTHQLKNLVQELDSTLRTQGSNHVNLFVYNGVQYIGLESRRKDYERDKITGTNHVERLIEAGAYNHK